MNPDLKISALGISFKNPLFMPAGILGVSASTMIRAYSEGAAAVTTKSISINPKTGHANPTVISYGPGLLNAVGLSNPGIGEFSKEIKKIKQQNPRIPVILNTIGETPEEMAQVAKRGQQAGADIIELNPSCPNVIHKKPYAQDPDLLKELIRETKKHTTIPILVKLSPNVPDIKVLAKAAEEAKADGITAINTAGPGMMIDIASRKPILKFRTGGMSGPAIRPLAVRCVWDIYETVKIPIFGIGGISDARDVIEMMMAGATMTGIGSALHVQGIHLYNDTEKEIINWLKKENIGNINDIIGAAHE